METHLQKDVQSRRHEEDLCQVREGNSDNGLLLTDTLNTELDTHTHTYHINVNSGIDDAL